MKNRELVIRRLEQLEGSFKTLNFYVTRGEDINLFLSEIRKSEDTISDLKSIIEREPMTPNEINHV